MHPLLGLSLAECRVTSGSDCGREMAFTVECSGSEPVTLAAETQGEFETWVETLRSAIEESASVKITYLLAVVLDVVMFSVRSPAWLIVEWPLYPS